MDKQILTQEIYKIIKQYIKESENPLIEDYIPASNLPEMQRDLVNRLDLLVRQGVPSADETTDSIRINFEFSGLTKAEKDELILGAIDNVKNPKRDITFEQAYWLRFTSYLRKRGWYIAKF